VPLNKHAPAKPLITTFSIGLHLLDTWNIIVDPKFSWNHNVSYVSKKATKILNLLHRHMYICRATSKQKAFRELLIPVLD